MPAHLKPFAEAFELAVRAGHIGIDEAMHFVELIESTVLEQRLRLRTRVPQDLRPPPPPPPKGDDDRG